jgi:hypothetical protein
MNYSDKNYTTKLIMTASPKMLTGEKITGKR